MCSVGEVPPVLPYPQAKGRAAGDKRGATVPWVVESEGASLLQVKGQAGVRVWILCSHATTGESFKGL